MSTQPSSISQPGSKHRYIGAKWLILSACVVILDQIAKALIVGAIAENTIGFRLFGDFLWIVHARNLGIAFSIGQGSSEIFRIAFFILLPIVFIIGASVFLAISKELTAWQRFSVGLIIGGGFGNLIDRIFRPEGVVDFLSFSLFGFLGIDRFATFNVADMSLTIGAILLVVTGVIWRNEVKE